MPFSYQNMQFWSSLSIPRVQLTSNSDSMAKFTIEKCVRAKVFNGFLHGIVKKWPEMRGFLTWKKKWTLIFYIWENPHFWSFFHSSRQKCIKNVCSDTLFYCTFCHRIRIWCQLDSGNAQRCLKLHILARKRHKTFRYLSKSIFLVI